MYKPWTRSRDHPFSVQWQKPLYFETGWKIKQKQSQIAKTHSDREPTENRKLELLLCHSHKACIVKLIYYQFLPFHAKLLLLVPISWCYRKGKRNRSNSFLWKSYFPYTNRKMQKATWQHKKRHQKLRFVSTIADSTLDGQQANIWETQTSNLWIQSPHRCGYTGWQALNLHTNCNSPVMKKTHKEFCK